MLSTILKKKLQNWISKNSSFHGRSVVCSSTKAKQKNDNSAHTNWHRASLNYRSLYQKRNKEQDTDQAMHCVFMSWHITVYAENCSLKENGENKEQKSPFTASSLMAMDIGWWLWHCVFISWQTYRVLPCMLKIVL